VCSLKQRSLAQTKSREWTPRVGQNSGRSKEDRQQVVEASIVQFSDSARLKLHIGVASGGCPRPNRRTGSLVPCLYQGSQRRAFQFLLKVAWSSVIARGVIAQPIEPPCTDPYARSCGRGRWATTPYADQVGLCPLTPGSLLRITRYAFRGCRRPLNHNGCGSRHRNTTEAPSFATYCSRMVPAFRQLTTRYSHRFPDRRSRIGE
jgi:hypothetical protein